MPRDTATNRDAAGAPVGLPVYLTSFVGREQAVAALRRLLAETRLLTLTGAGGCGKSRLAARVVAGLADAYPAGVWWVELAPVADPAHAPAAVAAALGVREPPGRPLLEALRARLRPGRALLAMDNCEHLLDACAALAEALLGACPGLTVLATSREALGVAGEVAWPAPALSLPAPEAPPSPAALRASEAARLFVERAAAARPGFALEDANAAAVATICRRLDGLPLALELAAARAKVLAVEEIAERLDDRFRLLAAGARTAPPRHRTLRAAIDWSVDLLTASERALLARLAVFAGGWTLAAAEAVCAGDGIAGPDVLDLLAHLVDKSLAVVQATDTRARYRLLETIRQYAVDCLRPAGAGRAGADAVRRRHARSYLDLAEATAPRLNGAGRPAALAALATEHDNLRAALRWTAEAGEPEVGLRLAGALWWFWFHRGAWSEGLAWLDGALAAAGAAPAAARARALAGAGMLAFARGDHAGARRRLEEAVAGRRAAGDRAGLAEALTLLVLPLVHQGEVAAARPVGDEAVALARLGDDRWPLALALTDRGIVAEAAGDAPGAAARFEEAVALMRALGDPWGLSLALRHLGYARAAEGDDGRAEALIGESLELSRGLGDRWFASMALEDLAGIAARRGDGRRAARLLGAAEAVREALGAALRPLYRAAYDRALAAARDAAGAAAFAAAWAEGRALPFERAVAGALGDAADRDGDVRRPAAAATSPATPVAVSAAPRLRIVGLGPADVERDGRALLAADWGYALPRDLLFFLLDRPPQTKEQIGLAFWPDATPEQLRRNLGVALHRARRALGGPAWVTLERGRYAFNRSLPHWFDVDAFEAALARADRAGAGPPAEREADARRALEEAVALYGGDYLEDIARGDWPLARREELRRRWLEALLALGERYGAAGEHDRAADAYRRAIAREPFLEAAHRGLMRCYGRAGEPGRALRHYAAVREQARDELGAAPAPETAALAARLRRGEPV